MGFYASYPSKGSQGVPIYGTIGSFPTSAATGALGVAQDTGILYEWNGSSWAPIASNAAYTDAVTASHNQAQYFVLSPTDITNGYVTLSTTPTTPSEAQLTVLGGILQTYGTDFTITGNQLSWSGTDLDGWLTAGDELYVFYW